MGGVEAYATKSSIPFGGAKCEIVAIISCHALSAVGPAGPLAAGVSCFMTIT